MNNLFYLVPVAAIIALAFAYIFFRQMMKESEGNATMKQIAKFVREGAMAYLKQQYKVVIIVFIVLAIMSSNASATMLWSRYCPSLRDTGMVSSVTGYLDFLSYMSAAAANLIFANAATTIGWSRLILVWLGLMVVGVIVALPYQKIKEVCAKTKK